MKIAFEKFESPYLHGEMEFIAPASELSDTLTHEIGQSPFSNLAPVPHSGGAAEDFEYRPVPIDSFAPGRYLESLTGNRDSPANAQRTAILAAAQASSVEPWADIESPNSSMVRTFNPDRNDKSGKIHLTAQVTGAPYKGSYRWTTPNPSRLTILTPESLATEVLAGAPGLTTIGFEVFDYQKRRVRFVTASIGVPQFIVISQVTNARHDYTAFVPPGRTIRNPETFDAVLEQLGLRHHRPIVIRGMIAAVESILVPGVRQGRLAGHNLRLIWQLGPAPDEIPDSIFNPRNERNPQHERSNYTWVLLGGYPSNLTPDDHGRTIPPTGRHGDPAIPNERINIFPGSFDLLQSRDPKTPEDRDLMDSVRRLMAHRRANPNDRAALNLLIFAFSRFVANVIVGWPSASSRSGALRWPSIISSAVWMLPVWMLTEAVERVKSVSSMVASIVKVLNWPRTRAMPRCFTPKPMWVWMGSWDHGM